MVELSEVVKKIDDVTAVAASPGNAHADHYLRGMANGLLLAQHIAHGREDEIVYIEPGVVNEFDYMAEADKTCSIIFRPENIEMRDFERTLAGVIDRAEDMNIFKKLFFRGKMPEEVGLGMPKFQKSVAAYIGRASESDINFIHGIIGVITEAGELAELLVAYLNDKPFDATNAVEEVGDVTWYLARILRGAGVTFEQSNELNIDKLHGRHGTAFDVFRDANRNLEVERHKLEKGLEGKQSSDMLSSLAAKVLSDPEATPREKSLAGSVLSQDETKGPQDAPHVAKLEDIIERDGSLSAVPPRVRNDPPLTGSVEHHVKKPLGDCEGCDC